MKVNSGQAPSTLIPEYIGSAFDAVLTCADNIDDVKTVSTNINDVVTVADNILNVNKVATDVGDVTLVAGNIDYVKDVAEGIEGLPVSGYIGDTPPTQPRIGATWYCTLDGRNYTWYKDVDSGQWVESSPQSTIETDPSTAANIFALWKRSAAEAGLNLVAGSFEEGGVLTSSTDVLLHKKSKSIYAWSGAFPKVVAAGSTPAPLGSGGWVDRSDVTLRSELDKSSGSSLVGSEHSGTVKDHIKTLISVDPFITLAARVIDGLHNARDYIASIGGGVGILSAKTYLMEDEYVPVDRVIMLGQGNGPSFNGVTTLKWAGGAGTGKAVVRSSKYPLGTEGSLALSGVGVQNCVIDADGCDVGLYSYYTTNNSDFDGVVTRNATIANTYIIKSWFTNYGKQQARDGKNRGIVIGKALFGETGDIAVNACGFGWMQCKSNGTAVSSYDPSGLSDAGAGLVLGTFANSNHFPSVQSEGNAGVGIHSAVGFTNSFGSVYLESNSGASSGEKCSWMNVSGGSFSAVSIQTVYLATNQTIKNNVGRGMIVDAIHRGDNVNSFTGSGEMVVLGGNLTSFSATDWTKVAKTYHQLLSAQNVNVRYSSTVQGATRFVTYAALAYPQVTIVPRATITLASALQIGIDANAKQNYGTSFTANVPVTIRHSAVTAIGAHNVEVGGTLPTTDSFFDIYINTPLLAGSGLQSPTI